MRPQRLRKVCDFVERLTPERSARTWKLFQISWYANLALAILSLFLALFFFSRMWHGYATNIAAGTAMMMAFVVIACVLLMGAGISRYQARLESQHLELRVAIGRLQERLDTLKKKPNEEPSDE